MKTIVSEQSVKIPDGGKYRVDNSQLTLRKFSNRVTSCAVKECVSGEVL